MRACDSKVLAMTAQVQIVPSVLFLRVPSNQRNLVTCLSLRVTEFGK